MVIGFFLTHNCTKFVFCAIMECATTGTRFVSGLFSRCPLLRHRLVLTVSQIKGGVSYGHHQSVHDRPG